jgi:hypothetical protein
MEAVRLDFVDKGPDPILRDSGDWGAKKRQGDDQTTLEIIRNRYRMIFGDQAPPLHPRQIQTVCPLMSGSQSAQVKQRLSNFNNSLRKWVVHGNGLQKYDLPQKQGRKEKVEELLTDCNFIWSSIQVSISNRSPEVLRLLNPSLCSQCGPESFSILPLSMVSSTSISERRKSSETSHLARTWLL